MAVESRVKAGKNFEAAWSNKTSVGKRLNNEKLVADKLFRTYATLSEEYKTLLKRSKDALFIADRATHYSIESNVAIARAKLHVRDTKVKQKIATATCHKLSSSKLSHFETWLTNGEHGDEEADVHAVKAVKEARVATDEANEAEVFLHKAEADYERTSIEVKELEKVLADATRRADMDCKKANEDDQALEQQKQVSDADSFLAGLEASKVAAERESKLSRHRCLESRKEEKKLTKQLKISTTKLKEFETVHSDAAEASSMKKQVAAEKMKAAVSKSKYAHLRVFEETAAFALAKHTACNNSKLLVQHAVDAEAAVGNLVKTSSRLHTRALETREKANALFGQTEKTRTEVAKLKEASRLAYERVLDTYNTWRSIVRNAIISKDNLFKSRRSEMDVLKKAPLRVRENLSKAYEIEKKRVDELVKKLKDHSDVQVKYGVKAKALKDKALSKDAAALELRRGIRKMEEQSAKKAERMMKKMMEGANELSDSVVKAEVSEETGTTGATGMTGETGSSNTGVTGATGTDEKTPAEDAMQSELVAAAEDAKNSPTGIESEIATEVEEGKKDGLKKSPLAHWLGPNALTDVHGCVTAAGDAFCHATGKCFSVSEPDQCPTALNEATGILEIKLPKCPWCVSGTNASKTAAARPFLFPSEMKIATKRTDSAVLSWSERMSKVQATNEVTYSKANKTFNQLASAAAVSNEMYTSENAHVHLQNLLKRLELQHFNASGAVKEVVMKRVQAAKLAQKLKEEQAAVEGGGSATGTSTGSTGGTGATGVADEHAKYAEFKVAKAELEEEASEAAAKYRDVETSDPEAHKKLLAVQEVVRSATTLKMVETARAHLKAVIDIFEEAGAETGGTGASGATGATGSEDEDADESESGPTGVTGGSQLSEQKAEMESLKQQHALKENEWADAREVMKNKLAAAEKALHAATSKPTTAKVGMDVTDEEVEEAIEGSSVLLHHAATGSGTGMSGASGLTSDVNLTGTKCKPLLKVDSTKSDSKCKMFTLSGEKCAGDLDYPTAEKMCKSHGAHVCAHTELVDAFEAGYQSKTFGWTATKLGGENAGRLVENIMQSDAGDMKKGINVKEVEQNVNKKAYGVHCCGTSLA